MPLRHRSTSKQVAQPATQLSVHQPREAVHEHRMPPGQDQRNHTLCTKSIPTARTLRPPPMAACPTSTSRSCVIGVDALNSVRLVCRRPGTDSRHTGTPDRIHQPANTAGPMMGGSLPLCSLRPRAGHPGQQAAQSHFDRFETWPDYDRLTHANQPDEATPLALLTVRLRQPTDPAADQWNVRTPANGSGSPTTRKRNGRYANSPASVPAKPPTAACGGGTGTGRGVAGRREQQSGT